MISEWKQDIGIDEIEDNQFNLMIYDEDTGQVVCTVHGSSPEQVQDRANKITTNQ